MRIRLPAAGPVLAAIAFVVFIIAVLVVARHARAQDGQFACAPLAIVEARAAEIGKIQGVKITRFAGTRADAFLRVVNAEEPATDWKAEAVILAQMAGGAGTIALVNGSEGCMAAFLLGPDLLQRAIAAAGTEA